MEAQRVKQKHTQQQAHFEKKRGKWPIEPQTTPTPRTHSQAGREKIRASYNGMTVLPVPQFQNQYSKTSARLPTEAETTHPNQTARGASHLFHLPVGPSEHGPPVKETFHLAAFPSAPNVRGTGHQLAFPRATEQDHTQTCMFPNRF
jgi:hypothetical protein